MLIGMFNPARWNPSSRVTIVRKPSYLIVGWLIVVILLRIFYLYNNTVTILVGIYQVANVVDHYDRTLMQRI